MPKKKIDIVTRAMTTGGAERVIAQLANYFAGQGINCEIVTMDKADIMYQLDPRVTIKAVGRKSDNKIIDRLVRYKELRNIIIRSNPDIVLTLPEDTGIYVILALIGSGIPIYVSERNNPWIMPDSKVTRILRRVAYPFAAGIIFQTEMAMSFFGCKIQKKGIVLPNPVDESRIPAAHMGCREKKFVSVGRLEDQKNFKMLIEAFAEFHKTSYGYNLVIFGEGKLRKELEALADDMGVRDCVDLPGRDKDVLNKIKDAGAFILTSDYEGMPNALIEAMCMGMPVISTDCPSGGPRELIINDENGLLIPVGDKEALVRAMRKISDPEFADRLGKNALKKRKELTDRKIFQQWHGYLFS